MDTIETTREALDLAARSLAESVDMQERVTGDPDLAMMAEHVVTRVANALAVYREALNLHLAALCEYNDA